MLHAPEHERRDDPGRHRIRDPRRTVLLVVLALLTIGTCLVLWPLAAPLVLGAWAAHLSRRLFAKLNRALHGRARAAGVLTAALVIALAAPLAVAITTLVPTAKSLIQELKAAGGGRGALAALVTNGSGGPDGKLDVVGLAKDYGAGASRAVTTIASMGADVVVGIFVFFVVFFSFLVDGERAYGWFVEHAPVEPRTLRRFSDAFHQAGRGLLLGTGLTAVVQGVLCGILFAALGVPRAMLLGMLSAVAALIPVTGTALVWLPVAAGLALTGHPGKALVLVALGAGVVGTVDNLMRPWLSERAEVGLSTTLVLVGIFGGIAAFGPWGLLFGPLVLRLAIEGFEIAKERGLFGRSRAVS